MHARKCRLHPMRTPDLEDVRRAVGARYDVLDVVGAGGMGTVFRARHRELGHMVAVKVLPPEIASSHVRQERFRREAQLAAHLSHPNVVPVYEFDNRGGLTFLIMPLVRGPTLESVLSAGPASGLPALLRILSDVGAALDFAHRRDVVHRDVKPSNILIEDETGRALLTDFGVALARSSAAGSLTVPGAAIGTPEYMAPEQMSGAERVDGRADLYALGAVAYEALTGKLPPAGRTPAELAAALRVQRADLSPAVASALVAPLAERPAQRPASAAEWLSRVERGARGSWRRVTVAAIAFPLIALAAWGVVSRYGRHAAMPRRLAVMPFSVRGTNAQLPPAQLPTWLAQRLGALPNLQIVSVAKVASLTGGGTSSPAEADSVALQLGAAYFVQPAIEFTGSRVTLTLQVFESRHGGRLLGSGTAPGSVDSLSQIMDSAWAQVLPYVIRRDFAPISSVTLPRGLPALRAYAEADEAWRRGDYATALDEYDKVLQADSGFAVAYFRRAIVVAQIDPREESLRRALAGAQRHQTALAPADSLLLDGYRILLDRGDGRAALQQFQAAADRAPDQPQVWFTLGEYYYHFAALFDQDIMEAERAFNNARDLVPNFAPAIAHLISLAHMRNDRDETARLVRTYEAFDSSSVVAEAVGIADTLLLKGPAAQLHLLRTLDNHSFTALEYLAFQSQVFATDAERQGPARAVLRALERRAITDSQRVWAARLAVAADLREGWTDSARARLAAATTPAARRERDRWLVLAKATGLDSLGDWRAAAARLATDEAGEMTHWALARIDPSDDRHRAALARLARDSAPLATSLLLDLEARQLLARGDTTAALARWDRAVQRYAVLRVPFDLAASLWPLRRDLARVALARHDTTAAARACGSFDAPIGYVDAAVWPWKQQFCRPLFGIAR